MKLFMIGMGGDIKEANIEVHDMRFVICNTKEEAFNIVKNEWYGDTLHIDSYTEIKEFNGYKIDFNSTIDENLYMIVYGGYKKGHIDELHDYHFVVATTENEAKIQGRKDMNQFNDMDHIDNVVEIFSLLGRKFGLLKGEYSFKNNEINHTYIKIIK